MGLRVRWLDAPGYARMPSFTMQIEQAILRCLGGRCWPHMFRTSPSRLPSSILPFHYSPGSPSSVLLVRFFFSVSLWHGPYRLHSLHLILGRQLNGFWEWLLHTMALHWCLSTEHRGTTDLGRTLARQASPKFELDDRSRTMVAFCLPGWLGSGQVC
jgi:hypothetical protein